MNTDATIDSIKNQIEKLEATAMAIKAERDALRSALKLIASCESHTKGDVVDIARATLARIAS